MLQMCIMSGYEGQLRLDKRIFLTLFAGASLTRPTIARQILAYRRKYADAQFRPQRSIFITICGGVELKAPTLSEEFIDLRELINSGELSMNDWDACMSDVARSEASVSSWTLMGGFSEIGIPSEKQEIDTLAVQQYLGNIPERAVNVLKYAIGQRDSERRATLKKALLNMIG